ncbi:MAG: sigma 54-interacting transcriptional regulator [Thermodesulfobacteriota bacterium]
MDNINTTTPILIIDDEESLRHTFQFFLSREGYGPVVTVASFEEGVSAINDSSYDLIISDIVLEGASGIDFLKRVRELGIDCPVIMITGYPNVDTAAEAVRLGAFDYIPKPVEKDQLLRTVRLAVQQRRLITEKQRAEKEREQYQLFLDTLFKSVTDAIITLDRELTIQRMNPAAKMLFNILQPAIREGQNIGLVCEENEFRPLKDDILSVLKNGKEIVEHRIECKGQGSTVKILSICTSPLNVDPNDPNGVVMVIRDMTSGGLRTAGRRDRFHRFIGGSSTMQMVYNTIENVGRVDASVLITGESGTGKELAAEALHLESLRKNRPLVKVDCTAIPENLLESELFGHKRGSFTGADQDRMGRILQADGGTLFLDEIGDISTMMQLRLLRFLQEKTFYPVGRDTPIQVDVRVIAATNVDLKEKVRQGKFREDLYFRLRVIDVILPALRERDGDITLLADYFVKNFAAKLDKPVTGISDNALQVLEQHRWPGNVRELEHVIERAAILCQGTTITSENLSKDILAYESLPDTPLQPAAATFETSDNSRPFQAENDRDQSTAEKILTTLQKCGGNKAKAARLLGIDRSTLYRKIRELQIDLSVISLE